MQLVKENTSRKIDSLGRISIPKSIRDRLEITQEDEIEFFLLHDGVDRYVCMTNHKPNGEKYRTAIEVLKEIGAEIPEGLKDYA